MLDRDYFFEFAGMPQSGKSTVEEIVAHYLEGQGFAIEEYRGGSRYSPLRFSSIADLNVWLACKTAEFVVSALGREKITHKIFLLDRGLIDRCMFTDALLRQGKIDERTACATKAFLTLPRLLKTIDGIFVFITTPEVALEREYTDKLVKSSGEVMEVGFLSALHLATIDGYNKAQGYIRNVNLIDTEQYNTQIQKTAWLVVEKILSVITVKENRLVGVLR